jgi:hypothetical protein
MLQSARVYAAQPQLTAPSLSRMFAGDSGSNVAQRPGGLRDRNLLESPINSPSCGRGLRIFETYFAHNLASAPNADKNSARSWSFSRLNQRVDVSGRVCFPSKSPCISDLRRRFRFAVYCFARQTRSARSLAVRLRVASCLARYS